MNTALLMVTDGRQECFDRTYLSLDAVIGVRSFDVVIIVDDSTNEAYGQHLDSLIPSAIRLNPMAKKRGFAGAIRAGWSALRELPEVDYVFHLEDDFTFVRHFSLRWMAGILERNPHLAQMALKRQPWAPEEIEAGGIVQMFPDEYVQRIDEETGQHYYDHNLFFTTNPSLYRSELLWKNDWPMGEGSEGRFTAALREQGRRFAYLGDKFDEPWVRHIGDVRTGVCY